MPDTICCLCLIISVVCASKYLCNIPTGFKSQIVIKYLLVAFTISSDYPVYYSNGKREVSGFTEGFFNTSTEHAACEPYRKHAATQLKQESIGNTKYLFLFYFER